MASTEQIQKIKSLAKNGESVNTIKEKLEILKSTVYYHFKKEVGQKQKGQALKIPENPEIKGEICGIFAGDGNFYYEEKNYKYRINFTCNINDDYWEELADFLEKNLQKRPHINKQSRYNRVELRYESKTLLEFIKKHLEWQERNKGKTINVKTLEKGKEFKKGFIRGLIDTDGHKIKDQPAYNIGTISKNLMETTSRFLKELDIENTLARREDKRENCQDMYRISIWSEDAQKINDKIRPRHPKKQFS